MTESERPTARMRPITDVQLPPSGRTVKLQDGRQGYLAGRSEVHEGKLVFVNESPRRVEEVWPVECRNYTVVV